MYCYVLFLQAISIDFNQHLWFCGQRSPAAAGGATAGVGKADMLIERGDGKGTGDADGAGSTAGTV